MTGLGLGLGLAPRAEAVARTVAALKSQVRGPGVFNDVQSILLHDQWYSVEQRALVHSSALTYAHFTAKQRASIGTGPPRPWYAHVTDDECMPDESASTFR